MFYSEIRDNEVQTVKWTGGTHDTVIDVSEYGDTILENAIPDRVYAVPNFVLQRKLLVTCLGIRTPDSEHPSTSYSHFVPSTVDKQREMVCFKKWRPEKGQSGLPIVGINNEVVGLYGKSKATLIDDMEQYQILSYPTSDTTKADRYFAEAA